MHLEQTHNCLAPSPREAGLWSGGALRAALALVLASAVLTSNHVARIQAPRLLTPVGTDPGTRRKVPTGLWPDIKDLQGAEEQ